MIVVPSSSPSSLLSNHSFNTSNSTSAFASFTVTSPLRIAFLAAVFVGNRSGNARTSTSAMRIDDFIAVSLVLVSLASSSIPNTSQRETVFEATVLNALVSLFFFFDDDAVNVVGFRMLRTARLFLFVVLNSVVKAVSFLDKDKDGAFNDDSRME